MASENRFLTDEEYYSLKTLQLERIDDPKELSDLVVELYARLDHYGFMDGAETGQTKDEAIAAMKAEMTPEGALEFFSREENSDLITGDTPSAGYARALQARLQEVIEEMKKAPQKRELPERRSLRRLDGEKLLGVLADIYHFNYLGLGPDKADADRSFYSPEGALALLKSDWFRSPFREPDAKAVWDMDQYLDEMKDCLEIQYGITDPSVGAEKSLSKRLDQWKKSYGSPEKTSYGNLTEEQFMSYARKEFSECLKDMKAQETADLFTRHFSVDKESPSDTRTPENILVRLSSDSVRQAFEKSPVEKAFIDALSEALARTIAEPVVAKGEKKADRTETRHSPEAGNGNAGTAVGMHAPGQAVKARKQNPPKDRKWIRDTGKYFTVVSPSADTATEEMKTLMGRVIRTFSSLGYTPRINASRNNEGIIPKGVSYVLFGKDTVPTPQALESTAKYMPDSDESFEQSCAVKYMALMGDGKSVPSDFVLCCSAGKNRLGPALFSATVAEDPAVGIPVYDIGRTDRTGKHTDLDRLRDIFRDARRGMGVKEAVDRAGSELHTRARSLYEHYMKAPEEEHGPDAEFAEMDRSGLLEHVFRQSTLHPLQAASPVHEKKANPFVIDTEDRPASVTQWSFEMPEENGSTLLEEEITVPVKVHFTEMPRNQYVWLTDTNDDLAELNEDTGYADDGVSRNTDTVALAEVEQYATLTTRAQLAAYMEALDVDMQGISNGAASRFFSPIDRRNAEGDRWYSHDELIAMDIMQNDPQSWNAIARQYFRDDRLNGNLNENTALEHPEGEIFNEM